MSRIPCSMPHEEEPPYTEIDEPGASVRERPEMSVEDARRWEAYIACPDDTSLRNALIERYMPIVETQATRLLASLPAYIERDDLVTDGVFGLMDAMQAYDIHRGVKFETFCVYRVAGAMRDGLRSRDFIKRQRRGHAARVTEARVQCGHTQGHAPNESDLAEYLDIDEERLQTLLCRARIPSMQNFQTIVHRDAHRVIRISDAIEDVSAQPIGATLEADDGVHRLFRYLPENEKVLMRLYYLENKTFREIATIVGVTESGAVKMHAKIIARLRFLCEKHVDKGDHLGVLFAENARK